MSDNKQPLTTSPTTLARTPPPPPRRPASRKFSRPLMKRKITLLTGHAQRVMERSFYPTAASLGRLSTIMYVLADEEQTDQLNTLIVEKLDAFIADLEAQTATTRGLLDDEGITETPEYSNAQILEVTFMSPAVYRLIKAMSQFDSFAVLIDTAWFAALVGNQEHTNLPYTWRNKFLALNTEIIELERRAQKSAASAGKSDEVETALHDIDADPVPVATSVDDTAGKSLEEAAA